MFNNYIIVALRNIFRNKFTSFINILSLSIGLACAILVAMMVIYENSFDSFHSNGDRIYRVYTQMNRPSGVDLAAPVQYPLMRAIEETVPEIEHTIKITEFNSLVSYEDKNFYEYLKFTDEEFFQVFSFPLKFGNPMDVLANQNSIVISEKMAEKYFGDSDPIGKVLKVRGEDLYTVSGVFYDLPPNSSIQADMIVSNQSLSEKNFNRYAAWSSFGNDYCFVTLKENIDSEAVAAKISEINKKNIAPEYSDRFEYHLMPINELHFSELKYDFVRTTPKAYLIVFSIIALFFLVVACINFINLSTARSAKRNKEVGIRKVIGASRAQLIIQFLSEAFSLTLISLLIGLSIISVVIPTINDLMNFGLSLELLLHPVYALIILMIILFTGLVSGIYPAFILSSAKPISVLKDSIIKNRTGYFFRSALVVFQFAISIFLIIGTLTVYSQIDFLLKKDVGFNKDGILMINFEDAKLRKEVKNFKVELLRSSLIQKASFSSGTPGSNISNVSAVYPEDGDRSSEIRMQILDIDYDFIDTYDLKILEGRNFSKEFSTDKTYSVLINKIAAKKLGYDEPIGMRIKLDNEFYTIIGVIDDFHYTSLKYNISPQTFFLNDKVGRFLSVQLSGSNITEKINFINEVYSKFSPTHPFDYAFLSDRFEQYYRAETTIGKLLSVLAILTIIISSIGILGLVSFTSEQKSKEIGVRKVLGASVTDIVFMLGREFMKWVIIANIIMWPVSYLLLNQWLNTFAYRSDLSLLIFAAAFAISIVITLSTVSYHSLKSALSNPVNSIKYE